jgi:hypothetical protein
MPFQIDGIDVVAGWGQSAPFDAGAAERQQEKLFLLYVNLSNFIVPPLCLKIESIFFK